MFGQVPALMPVELFAQQHRIVGVGHAVNRGGEVDQERDQEDRGGEQARMVAGTGAPVPTGLADRILAAGRKRRGLSS